MITSYSSIRSNCCQLAGCLLLLALLHAGNFAFVAPLNANQLTLEEVRETLRGPVIVYTKAGQSFTGQPVNVSREKIAVTQSEAGGGEVTFTFRSDEIRGLILPGPELESRALALLERGKTEEGLIILHYLLQARRPYFPYLPPEDILVYMALVQEAARIGDAPITIRSVQLVRPYIEDRQAQARLRDAELLAHYNLGAIEETRSRARAWIAAQPRYGPSALGWYILSRLALDAEKPELALQISLEPVVFSGQLPMTWLPACYATAIEASLRLEIPGKAAQLYAEMQERGLNWPDGAYFDGIRRHLGQAREQAEATRPANSGP